MNGLMAAPNGFSNLQDEVYGWDLNGGRGFESKKSALSTIDHGLPGWGSLWKIDWKLYELVPICGDRFIPYFKEYNP